MRILLVEDDELLGDGVRVGLNHYGHVVDWVKDGTMALRAIKTDTFDVIVLDIGLPNISGLSVLKEARAEGVTTPVLILTALDSTDDRVKGLDSGADDYLTKPFDLEELLARLRALHRRFSKRTTPSITHNNVVLDPSAFTVKQNNELINLPRREFILLQTLMENVGHVLSREQLCQSLYGWEDDIDSNTLEVHVHNIRKKLGQNFIRTIRGVGYMIEKAEGEEAEVKLA
ncbi:MAG: PmrA [uncultured bacterium]|nr:MAG: PmrA [uncultured bacterium]OGT24827.1 MAG: DNA-binding response regulator [Gammaproteobacteria bacterium RIFCSPHIGHO2_12_38_15]OGT68600.1 MAG: DNA-binding response regulator [Gammaproteobacteria bacterium RIFCSPLOWO2_02_FULL_38_11]OGT75392.1 MAG: DNA-binding response regulator [Gammaproteobacteria bacterium RIFCSPLOWO2_12_FULL_38_14]